MSAPAPSVEASRLSEQARPEQARPAVSALSFEDALAELEQIVRRLESGQQKLEDAITAYERGAALRKHCEAKLAEAEARVAAIVLTADGTVATRPLT